ncbi:Wzz/FepE/Etk N-terminal domain-containing protein [Pseudomonas synxantha]|uniref:Regulator of length of O-antigen component of lipopolysaccharide chain n=1 Tax=Pseudomonas synxantha TaxID=47883 RepID=A0AAU8TSV1_9PSED|nr:Wzz/FepE/Etk N-terminal domain-containing protein [Pseudomonas synxantha]AKA85322.1 regulator of length of O-antigen component of lipopolysaccharide chain [Pseudomonas synxantha]
MSSSLRFPPVSQSDEVDIVELVRSLGQQKKLILFFALGVGLLSAAYAFLTTPEYSVSSVLRPAALNELDALNRSEVYKLPPEAALIKVGASLESYETRLNFFRENQKLFEAFVRPGRTLEQSFENFNRDSIILTRTNPSKIGEGADITLQLNYPEGIDGVTILNNFVSYAIEAERSKIASDMKVIVQNRINEVQGKLVAAKAGYDNDKQARIASLLESDNLKRAHLQDELKALRTQLKELRTDRISQLDEAIAIARSLGINKPTTPSMLGEADRPSSNVMKTEINNQQIPLYFMGVQALLAERSALQRRVSDDFADGRIAQISKELQLLRSNREVEVLNSRVNEELFLSGVQPLRAEMARLRSLNIDMGSLKLVSIDKQALEPTSPTKPKRLLIIVLGVLGGLILGVAAAVASYFFRRSRRGIDEVPRS